MDSLFFSSGAIPRSAVKSLILEFKGKREKGERKDIRKENAPHLHDADIVFFPKAIRPFDSYSSRREGGGGSLLRCMVRNSRSMHVS